MKRFKESELKKTSSEYWILESIKSGTLTYDNPLMYQGFRIYHNDGGQFQAYAFQADDYDGALDANDHRFGFGDSVTGCLNQINDYILENEVEH
jgi:hypothetical protein